MAVSPSCRIARSSDGYVVSLLGPGTLSTSHAFREFVRQSLDSGLCVVVDLEACEYLDSTFMGCLIGLHKMSVRSGGNRFQIYAAEACRLRLLATSGLHQLLDFIEERPHTSDKFISLELTDLDERTLGRHVMDAHRMLSRLGGKDADKFRAIADRLEKELESKSTAN